MEPLDQGIADFTTFVNESRTFTWNTRELSRAGQYNVTITGYITHLYYGVDASADNTPATNASFILTLVNICDVEDTKLLVGSDVAYSYAAGSEPMTYTFNFDDN